MNVLFDHNVPKKLRSLLPGHKVATSRELALIILADTDRPAIKCNPDPIAAALDKARPGGFKLLTEPTQPRREAL